MTIESLSFVNPGVKFVVPTEVREIEARIYAGLSRIVRSRVALAKSAKCVKSISGSTLGMELCSCMEDTLVDSGYRCNH